MFGVQLNQRKPLSREEIQQKKYPSDLSSFETSVVNFCYDWLTGVSTFELKTSGSTGTPKIVTATREQLIESVNRSQKAIGFREGETALVTLHPDYVAGKMMLTRCLVANLSIIALEPSSNPLATLPLNCTLDFAAFVPYQIQTILDSKDALRLNRIRNILIGGGSVPEAAQTMLQRLEGSVYLSYGMTETLTHIALRQLTGKSPDHFFKTLPGISIHRDTRGCLVIEGDYFPEKVVVTNDLVELQSGGRFQWLGRWDNVINSGGIKIIPEVLEPRLNSVFEKLDHVCRYFLSGWPHEKLGQELTLLIEGQPWSQQEQELLILEMEKILGRFEVPRRICFIEKFIETENQKINRTLTLAALNLQQTSVS
jgi:o-succinylbenzoate---CoA ligase